MYAGNFIPGGHDGLRQLFMLSLLGGQILNERFAFNCSARLPLTAVHESLAGSVVNMPGSLVIFASCTPHPTGRHQSSENHPARTWTNGGGEKVCFQEEINFRLTSLFPHLKRLFQNLPTAEEKREGGVGGK